MRNLPTLVGQRFGKLVVEQQLETSAAGHRRWLCRCDCGNTHVVTTGNLKRRSMPSCGCVKSPDLTGRVFGRLTVLGRSDKRGARGKRTTPLWECRCACGAVTYKATDTLTNPGESMCAACAAKYAADTARKSAGFIGGTQLPKIRDMKITAANTSGCRGVYFDPKKNIYRVRLKFQGKSIHLGYFKNYEDAVKARKRAEEKYFEPFLEEFGQANKETQ